MSAIGGFSSDRQFNNADGFAMAFDDAWKADVRRNGERDVKSRLEIVMEALQDHPFMESSPEMARQVADFRLRLLDL